MARTKAPAKAKSPSTSFAHTSTSATASKIPEMFRFPLLFASNLTISWILYTVASPLISGDLATVSGHRDEWWEIIGLLGWKAAELAVGWWGGYDTFDLASLVLLSHLPYQFFLISFYRIRPTTAVASLAIDIIATGFPFYMLRGTLAYHHVTTPRHAGVANRSIIDDAGVQITTSVLASVVYAVVLFFSYGTWLPAYLVTHFAGIRDISALYESTLPYLIAFCIPMGFAAKTFLFTPTMAATDSAGSEDDQIVKFDPETSGLYDTVLHNVWDYSPRNKVLIQRTAALLTVASVHTWLHTYGAVEGAEGFGALGWTGIWAGAGVLTAIAFSVIGNVDGVSA